MTRAIKNQKSFIENYLKHHPAAAEYRFLFDCCRAAFSGSSVSYPENVRPKVFLEIVQHHKLIPQLYPILKGHCENISSDVLQGFRELLNRHNLHILKLSGELVRFSELFSAENIPWLSVKGPALALQLYGDITTRQAGDLDILVKDDHWADSISILTQEGYEMMLPEGIRKEKNGKKIGKQVKDIMFRHPKKKILVELHRKVSYDWLTPDDITSLLWDRPEKIRIGNEEIPVPNAANHLTFLYEHGNRHGWYRLAWLWDIALARTGGFGKELKRAEFSKELNRCFATADTLCNEIFGIDILPENNNSEYFRPINTLVHLAEKAMLYPEKTKSTKMALLRLRYMLVFRPGVAGKIKSLKRYFK